MKPGRGGPLYPRGSGRRRSQRWVGRLYGRLYRIRKPSRPSKGYRMPRWPHFVSLGPWPEKTDWGTQKPMTDSLEGIRLDWVSNYLHLRIPKEMRTWTNLDTDQVLQYYWRLFRDCNEENLKLQDRDADRIWLNVMLWCLRHQKKKALLLLLVTMKGRSYRPPRYAVADSLLFLSRHFLFEVVKPDPNAVDAIWLLTRKFIEGASEQDRTFTVPQHLIYNLIQHMDKSRLLSFFWLLGVNKVVLHANSMLSFLDRFHEMGNIDMSMRALSAVAQTTYDLSGPAVQRACVKLLRTRFDTPDQYTVRSNILAQMLEMGVRPKIGMFNAILLNAGEGGDFANAWKWYVLAREKGLVPDPITYLVLLKGAKLSGYHPNLNLVIREIQGNPEMLQNLDVLRDVLGAISLITVSSRYKFGEMLDVYKQYCDLRPLQDLSLVGSETQALPSADYHGLQPSDSILRRMILAYIHLHHSQPQGPFNLIRNYELYYQHIKENHPLIAPLAQKDSVANAFIMAFGQRSETLQHCIIVIKHMLELSSQRHATSDTTTYSAPTVRTWSILVAVYLSKHQNRAAEKVLELMRERGIEYNRVTWNTLISGHAGMQDVDRAVNAMKGMEAAGFEADAYTAKGLGRLRSRDKLMKALGEDLDKAPSNKTTVKGPLPPLSPEEEYEARQTLEWESKILDRKYEVRKYLDAKYGEKSGMESDNPI